jgi:hypothetical protein
MKQRLEKPHDSFTEGSNGSGNYRVIDLSSEKPINHKNASLTTHSRPSLPGFTEQQNLVTVNTVRDV